MTLTKDKYILKSFIKELIRRSLESVKYEIDMDIKTYMMTTIDKIVSYARKDESMRDIFLAMTGTELPEKYNVPLDKTDIKEILSLKSEIKKTQVPPKRKGNAYDSTHMIFLKI
jgi:hypothetical protein